MVYLHLSGIGVFGWKMSMKSALGYIKEANVRYANYEEEKYPHLQELEGSTRADLLDAEYTIIGSVQGLGPRTCDSLRKVVGEVEVDRFCTAEYCGYVVRRDGVEVGSSFDAPIGSEFDE